MTWRKIALILLLAWPLYGNCITTAEGSSAANYLLRGFLAGGTCRFVNTPNVITRDFGSVISGEVDQNGRFATQVEISMACDAPQLVSFRLDSMGAPLYNNGQLLQTSLDGLGVRVDLSAPTNSGTTQLVYGMEFGRSYPLRVIFNASDINRVMLNLVLMPSPDTGELFSGFFTAPIGVHLEYD